MLVIGGWFNGPLRETLELYASARTAMPVSLLVGPRFHIPPGVQPAYRDHLGYEGNLEAEIAARKVRFLHRCLKDGAADAASDEAPGETGPVTIHVMHDGWLRLDDWPPRGGRERSLAMAPDGRLRWDSVPASSGEPGTDTLTVDFDHAATYGSNGSSRWFVMPPGAPDSLMVRNRLDGAGLVWEAPSLEEALTVVGHPVLEVSLSADRPTMDLFVYLSDVGPDGRVVNVTEGQLRMNFHRPVDVAEPSADGVPIRPELPRHGFRSMDYVAAPLADGRTIRTRIDLLPTAWTFRAGHRVRVSVTGADVGNFELNPTLCPGGDAASCVRTELYIHRGEDTPSRLVLPIHGPAQ